MTAESDEARQSWRGANCAECPLRLLEPVDADLVEDSEIVVIEPFPSSTENNTGATLAGPEGSLFERVLPEDVTASYTFAVACRPPKGDLKAARRRARKEGLLDPVVACRPRLVKDIKECGKAVRVPLGAVSLQAMRLDLKEDDARGALLPHVRAVPSHSLWRVGRQPFLENVLEADIDRAVRAKRKQTTWKEPERRDVATAEEFWAAVKWMGERGGVANLAADIETDGVFTGVGTVEVSKIRCIGLGNAKRVVMVTVFLGDGTDVGDTAELAGAVSEYLDGRRVFMHNGLQFDCPIMQAWFGKHGVSCRLRVIDTILLARAAFPKLKRALGYLAHFLTDAIAWKEEKGGLDLVFDEDRWLYCARDVSLTAQIGPIMLARVATMGKTAAKAHDFPVPSAGRLISGDHTMQRIGRRMEENGLLIDQQRREERLVTERAKLKTYMKGTAFKHAHPEVVKAQQKNSAAEADLDEALFLSGVEPGEYPKPWGAHQLRKIIREWEVPLPADIRDKDLFTKTGMLATNDLVLCRLLPMDTVGEPQREVLRRIRRIRWHAKRIGTYLKPWAMPTGIEEDRCSGGTGRGASVVWPSGRIHSRWAFHQAATGRYASSGSNVQNIPSDLRDCIVTALGWVFVYSDMDQLEFRIAADRWGAFDYLDVIAEGLDVHQVTMGLVHPEGRPGILGLDGAPPEFGGKKYQKASDFDIQRQLAKVVQYLSQYKGGPGALFRALATYEAKDGTLLFAHLTPLDAQRLQEAWKQNCAAFVSGWDTEIATAFELGLVAEAIGGRWRTTYGAVEQEVVNFPIQGAAASMMNAALIRIMKRIKGKPILLVHQGHDSIILSAREDYRQEAKDILDEEMQYKLQHTTLTAAAQFCSKADDPVSRWSYAE